MFKCFMLWSLSRIFQCVWCSCNIFVEWAEQWQVLPQFYVTTEIPKLTTTNKSLLDSVYSKNTHLSLTWVDISWTHYFDNQYQDKKETVKNWRWPLFQYNLKTMFQKIWISPLWNEIILQCFCKVDSNKS